MRPEAAQHLRRAEELLDVAQENLAHAHPADSVSRSYYAMFRSATAVLKDLGIERKSHHALWAAFGEHVAVKGLMPPKYHRYGLDAFSARSLSEYVAEPEDTPEDAAEALRMAREFVSASRGFLNRR